jgi:putative transposase
MNNDAAVLTQAARLSLIKQWEDSKLSAEDFLITQSTRHQVLRHLSVKTLYRWRKTLLDSGPDALLPQYNRPRGAGSLTLTRRDKALIQRYYLHQNQLPLAEVVRMIEEAEGIKIAYNTALRYIQSLPDALIIKGRYGQKRLNDKCLPYIQRDYTRYRSMQFVTSDHHNFDFLVRDGEKVFRPWVTIFSDIRSRKPVGWALSQKPSGYTILSALEKMINEYGVPEELLVDNGKDYRSHIMKGQTIVVPDWEDGLPIERQIVIQGLFAALDCEVRYTEAYHGQSKPVERFFKDVAEEFSKKSPAYLGSNTATRPEDAKTYAATVGRLARRDLIPSFDKVKIDWENFIKKWSATHEHTGQGMDGKTPDVIFAENWSVKRIMPPEKKDMIFVRPFIRVVQRNGLFIDGVYYYEPRLITKIGQRLMAKRPLHDVSKIYICELDGTPLYEAYPNVHIDKGLPEENVSNVKKNRKAAMAALKKYEEHLENDPRDSMSAIQEAARKFHPTPSIQPPENQEIVMVAGGVPEAPSQNWDQFIDSKKTKKSSKLIGLLE